MIISVTLKMNELLKLLSVSTLICMMTLSSFCQIHHVIGHKNDTLVGHVETANKKQLEFLTSDGRLLKIPYESISEVIKGNNHYPVRNGVLAKFPFIDSVKAGFAGVQQMPDWTTSELFDAATEYIGSNTRVFTRESDGSTVATTYSLTGVRQGPSHQVDGQYRNETPVKFSDKPASKIVVRVVNRYVGGGFGCVRLVWFEYDLILRFKDGRYKYELTNYQYDHYNLANYMKQQFWTMEDGGDCSSSGQIENLLQCPYCQNEFEQMFTFLKNDSRSLIESVIKGISSASKVDEDW